MIVEYNHLTEFEELGILCGRNCIFADNDVQTGSTLKFKGEINCSLTSKLHNDIWIPYELLLKIRLTFLYANIKMKEASHVFVRLRQTRRTQEI